MDTDRPNQESAVMTVECPWCAAEATIETERPIAAFICATCAVTVELAADPEAAVVGLAA